MRGNLVFLTHPLLFIFFFSVSPSITIQTVRIILGQFKGLVGVVRETTDASCRIELHSVQKMVSGTVVCFRI